MTFRCFRKMLAAIGLFFLIVGCQTVTLASAESASPENSVSLPQGQNAGVWKGNYLVVDYKYTRGQSDMDLTGTVNFGDNITMNFVLLRDFRLSAVFLDENGRVLEKKALTTERGNFDPIPFHAKITVPANTASMSFSYQGTAIEGGDDSGGGGGITNFWQ
jgi:hypothetical protein